MWSERATPLAVKSARTLSKTSSSPGLLEIGRHDRLGVGLGGVSRVAQLAGRPKAQQLVAPGKYLEAQLLVMRPLRFEPFLPLLERARHSITPCIYYVLSEDDTHLAPTIAKPVRGRDTPARDHGPRGGIRCPSGLPSAKFTCNGAVASVAPKPRCRLNLRTSMKRRRDIYEGKAKILYEGTEPGTVIQYFKDDATAGNAKKKAMLEGKGVLNNRISEYLMTQLDGIGVPTHFVRRLNMREQLIKEVEIIPAGSGGAQCRRRLACPSGWGSRKAPPCPARSSNITTRMTGCTTPGCREEHITAFGWATPAGPGRHRQPDHPHQRFPVGPVPGRRHQAGGFQAGIRPAVGKRLHAHRAGRRDQPGQLPAVGHQHQREAGQGPFPPRSGRRGRSLFAKSRGAWESCPNRCKARTKARSWYSEF